jgi:hypothetical protein
MQRVDTTALADVQAVSFNTESVTEIIVIADEMESLRRRIASATLRFEMIGIADEELAELKADVAEFKRLCAVLSWRPQ